jgi:hypothetical protein
VILVRERGSPPACRTEQGRLGNGDTQRPSAFACRRGFRALGDRLCPPLDRASRCVDEDAG